MSLSFRSFKLHIPVEVKFKKVLLPPVDREEIPER